MAEPIVTRALRIEDYDAVRRLWEQSDGIELGTGDDRETIALYLARNPDLSRVALQGQEVVGAVLCGHDGRRGLIYHLAVAPTQRGQGLGRQLVRECAAGLRACGVRRALIMVFAANEAGRRFWVARGFEEIDEAVPYGLDL